MCRRDLVSPEMVCQMHEFEIDLRENLTKLGVFGLRQWAKDSFKMRTMLRKRGDFQGSMANS